jgi:hypothetical protein
MTDYFTAANSNTALSDRTYNKKRKLADDALAPTLYLLSEAGVSHDMISDVLFFYLQCYIQPPPDRPDNADLVWYAQLQRFRDELDIQIKAIETAIDEEPHN